MLFPYHHRRDDGYATIVFYDVNSAGHPARKPLAARKFLKTLEKQLSTYIVNTEDFRRLGRNFIPISGNRNGSAGDALEILPRGFKRVFLVPIYVHRSVEKSAINRDRIDAVFLQVVHLQGMIDGYRGMTLYSGGIDEVNPQNFGDVAI